MVCFALLPFLLMLLLWRRQIPDWRDRFIVAAVVWGAYAVIATEILSFWNVIRLAGICAVWVIAAILICVGWKFFHRPPTATAPPDAKFGDEKYVLLSSICFIAALLGLIAFLGPPNNWDSMSYHMPRVLHWMQNGNVAFYPTRVLRQNEMSPGAEYFILHLQLLAGNDQWANLVQWFAYVGCIIGVSCIARSLGGGPRSQLIAATFAATVPMACLQSGTTQNDLVSAFWLVCFITFIVRLCNSAYPPAHWKTFILCGASLGLALITKSTMYILAAPFGIGLVIFICRRLNRRAVGGLALLAVVALTINIPNYRRNYRFTHLLLGNGGFGLAPSQYENVHVTMGATTSNILRNLGLEFAVDPPPIKQAVESAVRTVHRWLRLDPDDPETSFGFSRYDLVGTVSWNSEAYAPNPFHVILIVAALLTMLLAWKNCDCTLRFHGATIVAGFVLFCAWLRIQPWHARLHLPMLIASGGLVGIVMERYWKPVVSFAICAALPLLVMPWILTSKGHPLLGPTSIFDVSRKDRYFTERDLAAQYRTIVDVAEKNHVKQIALISDGDCWEYPLEVMLRLHIPDIRFETYPPGLTTPASKLHTLNHGFDENLKPYLIVKLIGNTAEVVDVVLR